MENAKDAIINDEFLMRVVNFEMMRNNFYQDMSVMDGKMGVVIFLFHLARHKRDSLFEDFGSEFLDEICEKIHADTPWNFGGGLCGIAWGIEYLLYREFIEGNTDDILLDIDNKIMERDVRRMTDYSLETGLEGIAWYALARILSPRAGDLPFDRTYLFDLENACRKALSKGKFKGISLLVDYFQGKQIVYPFDEMVKYIVSLDCKGIVREKLSWKNGLLPLL